MQIIVFFILTIVFFLALHVVKTILTAIIEKHDFDVKYGLKKYLLNFFASIFSINSFIFLVVASSISSGLFYLQFLLSNEYPLTMIMEMDQARILGFGSILLIIIPLISIFSDDLKRIKEYSSEEDNLGYDFDEDDNFDLLDEINPEIQSENSVDYRAVNYIHAYTKYREKSKNPELPIKRIVNDILYIDGRDHRNFFDKKLLFTLKFKIDIVIPPQQEVCETIPSPDIAICQLVTLGTTHTQFQVIEWLDIDDYGEEIKKIKNNQDFGSLKPFIQLKEFGIGEKFTFNEMETTVKALEKMKKMSDNEV